MLWDAVSETDPAYTRPAENGLTSIDAYYKIKKATSQWGPFGAAWGLRDEVWSTIDRTDGTAAELVLDAMFFYPMGCFKVTVGASYAPGRDLHKMLRTDLLTKALSYLGFCADVFMGEFDDNKYLMASPTREWLMQAMQDGSLFINPDGGGINGNGRTWANRFRQCAHACQTAAELEQLKKDNEPVLTGDLLTPAESKELAGIYDKRKKEVRNAEG